MTDRLEALLDAARNASQMDRIGYRDALADEGAAALPALTEWLRDPRLGAFAVRVLARIGRDQDVRPSVVRILDAAEPEAPSPGLRSDILDALSELGSRPGSGRRRTESARTGTSGNVNHSPGRPGTTGRRYWAMRTSADCRDLIWQEARAGRLRQGWGWEVEQDLRHVADLVANGLDLTDAQRAAWRARRMLDTEPDGIRGGDLIVTQNLPSYGRFSVFRVTGSYSFKMPDPADHQDFGHVLPVELLAFDIDRRDVHVSEALRRAIALQPRLYEITPCGGDVEAVIAGGGGRTTEANEGAAKGRTVPEPEAPAKPGQTGGHLIGGGITEPFIAPSVESGRQRPVAEQLFDRLLESIGRRADEIGPTLIDVHWPHVGSNYRGTVILGQAVYGWADYFRASEFSTAEGRGGAIDAALARIAGREQPLDWIATHRVRTSPFWTCARLVIDALEPDDSSPWYSRFCWMNLYPCAPEDPKGNPAGALKEAQDPFVGELLRAQVERLDATRIIAFTGPYWWPAAGPAGLASLPEAPSPLMRAGHDSAGRTWIVGMHPAGASRHGCGPREYAQLIVTACRGIDVPAD